MDEPVCAYLHDLPALQSHIKAMVDILPKKTCLFYAIKANPDPKILKTLLPYVDGFEVASLGELQRVRYVSEEIPVLFGGPGKKEYELEQALKKGVSYIHVESLLELRKLIGVAAQLDIDTNILLRVNLHERTLPVTNVTMAGKPSPFGMDEWIIEEALTILQDVENTHVHFRGFHFHSLSNNKHPDRHMEMILLYMEKVEEWKRTFNVEVSVINVGGGLGVSYDDKPSFDWERFITLFKKSGVLDRLGEAELFFEPGRYIVADFVYYAAEMIDLKSSMDQHFAILRGGTHHHRLPASWGQDHPFSIVSTDDWEWTYDFKRPGIHDDFISIVGELCSPKDRLHSRAKVETLRVGDIVVFEKSGAYSWTISHHDFLGHPHPVFLYKDEWKTKKEEG
ncbi:type III PLP-dependent enzyme [Salicibibacter halophilus]|uniref:Type III PLP-dependent enzyme n=2 Tax=Salicibibacter halophilus TaxID=2502791 RepID=A0A514LMW6_9BACI|nr:type III PLP-dependent enzyme [Salicibibacter halophilus]